MVNGTMSWTHKAVIVAPITFILFSPVLGFATIVGGIILDHVLAYRSPE